MSAAVVLQAAGQDFAAGLRHQQRVFELGRAPPVLGHRRPAVGPRLVLPAACGITHGENNRAGSPGSPITTAHLHISSARW